MKTAQEIKSELEKQQSLAITLKTQIKEPCRDTVRHNTLCAAQTECNVVIKALEWAFNYPIHKTECENGK